MNNKRRCPSVNSRLVKIILIVFGLTALYLPQIALADSCNVGELLPVCTCTGNCKINDFLVLASNFAQWGVGLVSALAVGLLIWGGFTMLMAMGNTEKIEAGKKILGGTFRGMAIILLSFLLVNTIIFFATGRGDGFLYRGVNSDPNSTTERSSRAWWDFEETNNCQSGQECRDVKAASGCPKGDTDCYGWWIYKHNCMSLGVCVGDEYFICCNPG